MIREMESCEECKGRGFYHEPYSCYTPEEPCCGHRTVMCTGTLKAPHREATREEFDREYEAWL